MALPSPGPNSVTPNNPFYSTETYVVQGAYNNLIVGQNLFVDQCGCLSATPGGPIGTVYSVGVGTGLCTSVPGNLPITGAGNIALADFGPGAITTNFPAAITLDAKGRVSAISPGNPPVTSVSAGTGLCTSLPGNAPITTIGSLSLCALNPNPAGTFTNATVTVNAYGQVTGAVAGTGPVLTVNGTLPIVVASGANTNVSVNAATSSTCGVVHGCTAASSTALGVGAGSGANFASSGNNVALGVNANVASWTGTQLAIGSNNGNWLTGCNDLSIKPGAGIRDCTNSVGTTRSLLRSGQTANNLEWSEIGYTVSQVANSLSNVYFGPSSTWSVEWSPTGSIAQPGAGLFLAAPGSLYFSWSSWAIGTASQHYQPWGLVPSFQKFLIFGGGLGLGATQYVNLTQTDSTGEPIEGYQITFTYGINAPNANLRHLFVITRVF